MLVVKLYVGFCDNKKSKSNQNINVAVQVRIFHMNQQQCCYEAATAEARCFLRIKMAPTNPGSDIPTTKP